MCNQREIYKTISRDQVRKIEVRDLFLQFTHKSICMM